VAEKARPNDKDLEGRTMKFSRAVLAVVGASALLVGTMAGPAMAETDVPIYGGTTTITTTAKSLPAVTKAGIIMIGIDGADSAYVLKDDQTRQWFDFDIVVPSNLLLEDNAVTQEVGSIVGGKIAHSGSIEFINTNNGKAVHVGTFFVNFNKMKVFAKSLNGDTIDPLPVFKVVPVETPLYPVYEDVTAPAEPTFATVSGVKVLMTGKAANALNSSLKTKVFEGGLKFGKVVTVAELVAPV
jgi:hypothetical protein